MLKKYAIAITIAIFVLLLLIATIVYPGGSRFDKNSIGFNWTKNYISNLFGPTAVNGSYNSSRHRAICAMLFLSLGFGMFYHDFSKRIPAGSGRMVIRYAGISSVLFAFLIVPSYHDLMVTLADIFSMLAIFYVTVYVFKTKLHFHKVLCCICLLALYFLTFIYYSGYCMDILAIMQKADLAVSIIWMLSLQYFSGTDSFKPA